MKTLSKATMLLTSFCMAISTLVYGQTTIPNGGFEAWQNVSSSDEEPTNWNGNRTGGGFANLGPQTCFRETSNVHSGSYCLKLDNGSFFGTPVNATATTGKIEAPTTSAADGYIHTLTGDPDFSSTFTGRPDSLVGWFKFTQGGSDIGRIQAMLHDSFDVENPDQGSSAVHIIGQALYDLPNGNTSAWTRFAVPFTYNNGTTPSYILLIATASTSIGGANANSILWVDDLSVVYCSDVPVAMTDTSCVSYTSPSGKNWATTGIYMDTLPSGNCDSIFTIDLTILTVDTSVTNNGTSLTANATNATFQWVDCNNSNAAIPGETNATFSPVANGDYAVEVTQNGCTSTSACYNFIISDMNELAFSNDIYIYPNPNKGQFNIDLGT
ncbi:PCMD domain-containing protein, partial [Aureispira]|nr:PCMD domain-containing protein [Aureispira sp.]